MKLTFLLVLLVFAGTTCLSGQPEAWEEKPIYATNDRASDAIVTVKALFAPGETPAVSEGKAGKMVHWDPETMRVTTQTLEIPAPVRSILSRVNNEQSCAKSTQKPFLIKDGGYVYSVDIFPPYRYLYPLYQSFGRVFAFLHEPEPIAVLHVSGLPSPRVNYCALEARKGLLPVFFTYDLDPLPDGSKLSSHDTLGIVSVETGQIQTLGRWADENGNPLYGPIAWIDDHTLALVSYARNTTRWAAFDVDKKAWVAEGVFRKGETDHFVQAFLIRDGCLYGLSEDGSLVIKLYPAG